MEKKILTNEILGVDIREDPDPLAIVWGLGRVAQEIGLTPSLVFALLCGGYFPRPLRLQGRSVWCAHHVQAWQAQTITRWCRWPQ